jgi:hypothetical protein
VKPLLISFQENKGNVREGLGSGYMLWVIQRMQYCLRLRWKYLRNREKTPQRGTRKHRQSQLTLMAHDDSDREGHAGQFDKENHIRNLYRKAISVVCLQERVKKTRTTIITRQFMPDRTQGFPKVKSFWRHRVSRAQGCKKKFSGKEHSRSHYEG